MVGVTIMPPIFVGRIGDHVPSDWRRKSAQAKASTDLLGAGGGGVDVVRSWSDNPSQIMRAPRSSEGDTLRPRTLQA